jgi:hypothetical protein
METSQSAVARLESGRQLVGEGTLFLLKVAGDSMINAAIADGDWVVVRHQEYAENGDIVAAMLDGGTATVKTFKRSAGHVWLIPHNPAYTPILGDEASILGRVVAVVRRVWPQSSNPRPRPLPCLGVGSRGGRILAARRTGGGFPDLVRDGPAGQPQAAGAWRSDPDLPHPATQLGVAGEYRMLV